MCSGVPILGQEKQDSVSLAKAPAKAVMSASWDGKSPLRSGGNDHEPVKAGAVLYKCLLWMFSMDEANLRSKLATSSLTKARLKSLMARVDALLEIKNAQLTQALRVCAERESA
jgi:hypothetical protein